MNAMVSLSNTPMAHPPRSNPPLRSSSVAAPFPCITPSTVTCVMVVSFMRSPFLRDGLELPRRPELQMRPGLAVGPIALELREHGKQFIHDGVGISNGRRPR